MRGLKWAVAAAAVIVSSQLLAQDAQEAEPDHLIRGAYDALLGWPAAALHSSGYERVAQLDRNALIRRPGGPVDRVRIDPENGNVVTRIEGDGWYNHPHPSFPDGQLNRRACDRDLQTLAEIALLRFPGLIEQRQNAGHESRVRLVEPQEDPLDARSITIACLYLTTGTASLTLQYAVSPRELEAEQVRYRREFDAARAARRGLSLTRLDPEWEQGFAAIAYDCTGERNDPRGYAECKVRDDGFHMRAITRGVAHVQHGRITSIDFQIDETEAGLLDTINFWYGRPEIVGDEPYAGRVWRFADGDLKLFDSILTLEFPEGAGPEVRGIRLTRRPRD